MSESQKMSPNRSRTPVETSTRALQILRAADELLAEHGHDGVSMRDIAQLAGVNKALIFYYFGSRAQLFDKVLERYYRNHAKALAKAFSTSGDIYERVHRGLDAYLDFVDNNPQFSRLVQQELSRREPQLTKVRDNLRTLFEMLRDELSELLPDDGPLASKQFFVSLAGIIINYHTYSTALSDLWEGEPQSDQALADRREHVHWLADAMMERLFEEYRSLE